MCGILGVVSKYSDSDTQNFECALDLLNHRGPDGKGVFYEQAESSWCALGHTRLSIVDLSEKANQPFVSSCGRYLIIYNGELYNYKYLQSTFLSDQKMETTSDTEVLLKLFITYGDRILNMLDGIFAFAVYDKQSHKLFCARDQLGIKPFYYVHNNDSFVFSSEIKPLFELLPDFRPELDEYALYEFMRNSFVYEPHTGFMGVSKLGAGEYCIVDVINRKMLEKTRYWLPWDTKHNKNYSIEAVNVSEHDLQEEIQHSIQQQMLGDVPVGIFFSGGVDSTIILSELKNKLSSVTVKNSQQHISDAGFSDDYVYAKKIAEHLDVTLNEISFDADEDSESFLKNVEKLALLSEELVADYTFIASMKLSKSSKDMGFTVMLSGMGADEVFGGYPRYRVLVYRRLYCLLRVVGASFLGSSKRLSKIIDRLKWYCHSSNFVDQYTSILGYFSKDEVIAHCHSYQEIFDKRYQTKLESFTSTLSSSFKKASYLDIFGFMAHNFTVADKSSMQASVELRVPLATKNLFEAAFGVPDKKLVGLFRNKKPLREFLVGKFPKKIFNRKKAGFHPPMDKLIMSLGKQRISDEFARCGLENIIKAELLAKVLNEHFSQEKNSTYRIFQLLYLSYWYKQQIVKS